MENYCEALDLDEYVTFADYVSIDEDKNTCQPLSDAETGQMCRKNDKTKLTKSFDIFWLRVYAYIYFHDKNF